jgi:hypothetical protein
MVVDTSHQLRADDAAVLTVDKQSDSVDLAIINRAQRGDILVTQDYGLAAMALGKGLRVMHQSGKEFTEDNIDELLFTRALSGKLRRAGRKTSGPRKRTRADDLAFADGFRRLLQEELKLS